MQSEVVLCAATDAKTFPRKDGKGFATRYTLIAEDGRRFDTFKAEVLQMVEAGQAYQIAYTVNHRQSPDGKEFTNYMLDAVAPADPGQVAVSPRPAPASNGGGSHFTEQDRQTSIVRQSCMKAAVEAHEGVPPTNEKLYSISVWTDTFYTFCATGKWIFPGGPAQPNLPTVMEGIQEDDIPF